MSVIELMDGFVYWCEDIAGFLGFVFAMLCFTAVSMALLLLLASLVWV